MYRVSSAAALRHAFQLSFHIVAGISKSVKILLNKLCKCSGCNGISMRPCHIFLLSSCMSFWSMHS